MKEVNGNDYLIRLCDQSGKDIKFLYSNLTHEQLNKILDVLEANEKDWE